MSDYYEKLGNLLSEVLETGVLPESKEPEKFGMYCTAPQAEEKEKRAELPPAVKKAFKTLSIPEDADAEKAKTIYRKKLQRFHPDKQGDNAVLQTVARKKTAGFIEAWAVIDDYFTNITH